MKKGFLAAGIALLAAAVVLVILGTGARSLFYGIMDAPYSVYGKYGVLMRAGYIGAAVCAVSGVGCLLFAKRRKH